MPSAPPRSFAYIRFRDFRIPSRHVRIRMAQNLGDDVDRHAVFDGQRGERMPGAVGRQVFRDIAYPGQFFQVGIHLRVGGNG